MKIRQEGLGGEVGGGVFEEVHEILSTLEGLKGLVSDGAMDELEANLSAEVFDLLGHCDDLA